MIKKLGLLLSLLVANSAVSLAPAASPWDLLIPFRRVEADPEKSYTLTEAHGPWMIMASSFAGPGAEQQARQLVLELRRDVGVIAFVHKQTYDFTDKVNGLGLDKYGSPKKMRYANAAKFDEIAVLVGHFESVDDPRMQKVLDKLKYARPECLEFREDKPTTQRFAGLRALHRKLTSGDDTRSRGPMGNAFATRNPLLPEDFFQNGGIDPLVEAMNRNVEFSLLKNPGRYTVRVATFRGNSTMKLDEIKRLQRNDRDAPSKLEQAALKAHQLTEALRQQGVDAYEFHDRYESIVTVGSFESVGQPRADGKMEINPTIHKIMEIYEASEQTLPGQASRGLVPKTLAGITFDVQPLPVEVPKRSIAADYLPGNRLFQ